MSSIHPTGTPSVRRLRPHHIIQPWDRNPLLRSSDRLQATVRILAVVAILAAVPASCSIGTALYTQALIQIKARNASEIAVTGTLLADPVDAAPRSASQGSEITIDQDLARAGPVDPSRTAGFGDGRSAVHSAARQPGTGVARPGRQTVHRSGTDERRRLARHCRRGCPAGRGRHGRRVRDVGRRPAPGLAAQRPMGSRVAVGRSERDGHAVSVEASRKPLWHKQTGGKPCTLATS